DSGDDDSSHDGCKGTRPGRARRYPGPSALLLLGDELDGVADGADALGFLVRDLHAELVLQAHDQLDDVERVGAEVLLEARLVGHLAGVSVQLVSDDVSDLLEDLLLVHCALPPEPILVAHARPGPGGPCPWRSLMDDMMGGGPHALGAFQGPRIITA